MFNVLQRRLLNASFFDVSVATDTPGMLTHLCALLMCSFIILQIPVVLHFTPVESGRAAPLLLCILVHAAIMLAVSYCLSLNRLVTAKLLLVAGFTSYLAWSTLLWTADIGTPYFLLLAIFVIAFIFAHKERALMAGCTALVSIAFVALQVVRINALGGPTWQPQQYLQLCNQITLLAACLLTSVLCHQLARQAWTQRHLSLAKDSVLLSEILPKPIARCWQHNRQRIAVEYPCVSVVFADMNNFTRLAQTLDDLALVTLLDDIHREFDQILTYHGLEKVKTNGDQYIAVAGLYDANTGSNLSNTPAQQACRFALAITRAYRARCKQLQLQSSLRTGISSGPVIAGIIGAYKPVLDLWGNTVNLASRMESHGLDNHIQLDASTYQMTSGQFTFTRRDHVWLKGIGFRTTYLLKDDAVELSTN
ncbi:adenylate/guanylate cyclase domain-containing protein [Aestuariibacter salexigens]|uniref:adenylate/guanylate cyclase domain-containing protein n=1 Tax=Aestuariibacter salexigens TaxID=226010 RepID=UPI00146FBB11|nr:adenylate/guanylate cyclase domain-containing protein [Aestuariibacter salexigens]